MKRVEQKILIRLNEVAI